MTIQVYTTPSSHTKLADYRVSAAHHCDVWLRTEVPQWYCLLPLYWHQLISDCFSCCTSVEHDEIEDSRTFQWEPQKFL